MRNCHKFSHRAAVLLFAAVFGTSSLPAYARAADHGPGVEGAAASEAGTRTYVDICSYPDRYQAGLQAESGLIRREDGTVSYQGVNYRRKANTQAILAMGIDRSDDLEEAKTGWEGGQSDGIFLMAYQEDTGKEDLILIPRDSLTRFNVPDKASGLDLGDSMIGPVTLAYAVGDGKDGSCANMKEAVSGLLAGLPIDHYAAFDMAVLSVLNDAVGGVTVTIPTEGMESRDPAFVYGSEVTLQGSQAEKFLRFRDITKDGSALQRLEQHKAYIRGFEKALAAAAGSDLTAVLSLRETIRPYIVTDMLPGEYTELALAFARQADTDSIRTLPGQELTGTRFDEYYVDYEQAIPMLLELFYEQI